MVEFLDFDPDVIEQNRAKSTSLVRRLWIQGRISGLWENVTRSDDDKQALKTMTRIILSGTYDAARLIESHVSLISGNNGFKHLFTIYDHKEQGLIFETDHHHNIELPDEQTDDSNVQPSLLDNANNIPSTSKQQQFDKVQDNASQQADSIAAPIANILEQQLREIEIRVREQLEKSILDHAPHDHNHHNAPAHHSKTTHHHDGTRQATSDNVDLKGSSPNPYAQAASHKNYEYTPKDSDKRAHDANNAKASHYIDKLKNQYTHNRIDEARVKAVQAISHIANSHNDKQSHDIINDEEQKNITPSTSSHANEVKNNTSAHNDSASLEAPLNLTNPIQNGFIKNSMDEVSLNDNTNYGDNYSRIPTQLPPKKTSIKGPSLQNAAPSIHATPKNKSKFLNDYDAINKADTIPSNFKKPLTIANDNTNNKGSRALMSGVLAGVVAAGLAFGALDTKTVDNVLNKVSLAVDYISPYADLTDAITNNNPILVRELLEDGANPNMRNNNGEPVLLMSARHNDITSFNLLLQSGADWTLLDKNNRPIIHTLSAESLYIPLKELLRFGANTNYVLPNQCLTALHYAVRYDHARAVALLSQYGANFDAQENCLERPEDLAKTQFIRQALDDAKIARQQQEQQQQLTRDIAEEKNDGNTQIAALNNTEATGNNRNHLYPELEQHIINAVSNNDIKQFVTLLNNKPSWLDLADIHVFTSDQYNTGYRNLTDYAVLLGHYDLAKLTRRAGVNFSDELLHYVIDNAGNEQYKEVVDLLLSLNGSIDSEYGGLTPLMRATMRNDASIVENLLIKGANPHLKNARSETASDLALLTGNEELIELLISAEKEDSYRDILGGLFWIDSMKNIESASQICRDIRDNFRSCLLKKRIWMDELGVIIVAHFDKLQNNKLVNIQIDAPLRQDPKKVLADFDRYFTKITNSIPGDHQSFVERYVQNNDDIFKELADPNSDSEYYAYWADEGKVRPVFIHLKIRSEDQQHGGVRVRIGNPFRAS